MGERQMQTYDDEYAKKETLNYDNDLWLNENILW